MKIQMVLIIITSMLLTSCKENFNETSIESEIKYLYDFDKVEHYYLEIDDSDLKNIYPEHKECIDMVIYENYPMHLDMLPWCYDSLEFFGFTKKIVPIDKLDELNNIFVKNKVNEKLDTECMPIFRDVLVLYHNNKFEGVISICFSCLEARFINAGYSTSDFGYNGEYEKLEKLLY